ncbi:hypothetical protein AKJ09_05143 [Labilithrix luteola]|uniref:Uncharacterized protein n=1 Tax=Labilithrix luteola TaxID=1391654 RepID=A0A0K1PZ97_9BACT|nr:hypothetical protein AKJ09_05143 [Labilithrix luteola]
MKSLRNDPSLARISLERQTGTPPRVENSASFDLRPLTARHRYLPTHAPAETLRRHDGVRRTGTIERYCRRRSKLARRLTVAQRRRLTAMNQRETLRELRQVWDT